MSKRQPILPKRPFRSPSVGPAARQAMTPSPGRTPELRLRSAIQEFAFQPRFSADFNRALRQFFGEEIAHTQTLVAEEEDLPAFQEWYFFDYLTKTGELIIDIFAREQGPRLSAHERELLGLWRHGTVIIYSRCRTLRQGSG